MITSYLGFVGSVFQFRDDAGSVSQDPTWMIDLVIASKDAELGRKWIDDPSIALLFKSQASLPNPHIQDHHHRKAPPQSPSSPLPWPGSHSASLTLGDQLLHHHEDHRPRRSPGRGGGGIRPGSPPPPPRRRLSARRSLKARRTRSISFEPSPRGRRGMESATPSSESRCRWRGDRTHQGGVRITGGLSPEGHPPRPAPRGCKGVMARMRRMIRCKPAFAAPALHEPEKPETQQWRRGCIPATALRKSPPRRKSAAAGSQAGRSLASAISIAGARSDQKLAGDHHPRGEAQHSVQDPAANLLEGEDAGGTEGGHPPGKASRKKRLGSQGETFDWPVISLARPVIVDGWASHQGHRTGIFRGGAEKWEERVVAHSISIGSPAWMLPSSAMDQVAYLPHTSPLSSKVISPEAP